MFENLFQKAHFTKGFKPSIMRSPKSKRKTDTTKAADNGKSQPNNANKSSKKRKTLEPVDGNVCHDSELGKGKGKPPAGGKVDKDKPTSTTDDPKKPVDDRKVETTKGGSKKTVKPKPPGKTVNHDQICDSKLKDVTLAAFKEYKFLQG